MLLYPRARVHVIIPLGIIFYPLWIRAVWVVGVWFAIQLASAAFTDPTQPGTAFWAHVGGFAAGLILTPFLKSRDVRYFGPYFRTGPWNCPVMLEYFHSSSAWHGFRSPTFASWR
jgi:membrane associated rhomboid family serine protease